MKKLLLLRHAESEYLSQNFHSQLPNDSSLSEFGRRQAHLIANHFSDLFPDLVLTSLYRRAQETADILNDKWGARKYSSAALNEFFLREDGTGVETTEQGLARCYGYLNQFRAEYDTIAIVGHNSLLSVLMSALLNKEQQKFFEEVGTCYLLRFDWEKGDRNWRIVGEFVPEGV